MKILSPAGNMESLKMAVINGADEVYLGINDFNARNNIDGFTVDTLKDAIDYAHIYGVKVHLALNILFTNEELQKAIDIVCKCINMGIDAFIVQDLGLISLINRLYPEAEVHLSTQMGIHNLEGILALSNYKFKRVVLSRETPLEEIKRIRKHTNIEIEYFVQGALCVSFSGNCYMSSYLFNASGNRGRCKQLCRLPFTLKKGQKVLKNGYLLSAKDFNMIKRLDALKEAGVDAIKIEGRARRPFYVGATTRQYYNALNGIETDIDQLKLAFNRTYTEGYFNGNGNIISELQNHVGIKVGKVQKVEFGKRFNKVIFTSNRALNKKSTFKFILDKKETTITAYDLSQIKPDTYLLTTTSKVEMGSDVHLIIDQQVETQMLSSSRKAVVDISLLVRQNQPITARVAVKGQLLTITGDILQPALNQPLTKEKVGDNFNKGEYFTANISFDEFEKVFIPKQKLNDFRRKVYAEIESVLTKIDCSLEYKNLPPLPKIKVLKDFAIVKDLGEEFLAKTIIYSPEIYTAEDVLAFVQKCNELGLKPYLDTPNFALEKDIELLKDIEQKTGVGIVANNYYALTLSKDLIIGAGLNVYNSYTAGLYGKPFVTAESDVGKRVDYYYMTLRHCPMKNLLNAKCDKCPYEKGYSYQLDSGKTFNLQRKKLTTCTFYLTD